MPRLLVVSHCPSPNTTDLRDAVLRGARHPDIAGVEIKALNPLQAAADDVQACDGVIIGTTENFGYMAGLTKDFFERIYYPCLDKTQGLPVALYIRAGEDGSGTRQGVERILAGLRWKPIQETLILRGKYTPAFLLQVEEMGMTMAAGLEAGIF